jgi:hypothetical protein
VLAIMALIAAPGPRLAVFSLPVKDGNTLTIKGVPPMPLSFCRHFVLADERKTG